MFERYTEKARRVVFFARYEASQYGAKEIGTEHLLLGLMREDRMLMNQFLGPKAGRVDLRADMEREITRGERVSTSWEMPLSAEGKKVLTLAGEEAQRMGRRQVSTEHLLLALLGVKGSLAERTLVAHGMKLDEIRQALVVEPARDPEPEVIETHSAAEPLRALIAFLDGLSTMAADLLLDYFADDASFIDWQGKRWNRAEIDKTFDDRFAKYAKKNATYLVEMAPVRTGDRFVVSILWKNALLASERRGWMHRMGMVWIKSQYGWQIGFAQVTVVAEGADDRD